MLRLLGRATSGNVQKVLWLLEEMGLEYSREDYGRQFENTADAAYLSLNPTGKVPTLVDGDTVVWESNSILRYLAAREGSAFLPADPGLRAQVELWMDWLLASLNGPYLDVFRASKKSEEERGDIQTLCDALAAQLAIVDGHLSGREWLAGDAMTLSEFALGPIVQRCLNFPVELPAFPDLRRWQSGLGNRPAFEKVVS